VRSGIEFKALSEYYVNQWFTNNLHLVAIEFKNQPVGKIVNVYSCNDTMKEDTTD